ncbi:MAG: T9SS type A sorting domain-containing protein [Bacteroidales bacterium]|jgi:hypothetical protein|nr:T9SS type A sorting domain-containing protein [Bacteroidales bacterium]
MKTIKNQIRFSGLLFLMLLLTTMQARVFSQTYPPSAHYTFDVNNVSANIRSTGHHFNSEGVAGYEVPKGSEKTTLFSFNLWIGGLGANGQLHLAAERFNQHGVDYTTGPLSVGYAATTPDMVLQWDKIWVVDREEIFDLVNSGGTQIAPSILAWPAHGDTTVGQDFYLAPFFDNNQDGIYNPQHGDYPLIKGDRAAFFIFNDAVSHTESGGVPLGVEIQGMVYGFNAPQDELLNNTVFVNYKLVNRSSNNYHDVYLGLWSDIDLGYAFDDYIGCDVQRSSYYGYNGTPIDGNGQAWAYGVNPPVQLVTLLAGPVMDADNRDNPLYDKNLLATNPNYCDQFFNTGFPQDLFTVNGANFGDNVVDNERLGLTGFIYFNNANSVIGDPSFAGEYYQMLKGFFRDGMRLHYGGNGHPTFGTNHATGPECNYMFPGLSDPCNFGTNGINSGILWTETECNNPPYDRRGIGSCGPFTFNAGAVQELDFAFITIFSDTVNNIDAIDRIAEIDSIINMFTRQQTSSGQPFTPLAIYNPHSSNDINVVVYPNPASQSVTIKTNGERTIKRAEIYNMLGKLVKNVENNASEMQVQVNDLLQGIYFIKLFSNQEQYIGTYKMVKQ